MPTLFSNSDLKYALSENGFIKGGKIENIDGVKYDFCLSSQILKSKFKQPINIASMPDTMKREMVIEPGEVVFALTEEIISLPDNVMAILIPKRKLSHGGVMIMGGLSVDPLYQGRLLIGLYNFSSTDYPIIAGRKLIGAHFYKLDDDEKSGVSTPEKRIYEFPEELIHLMQSYKPVSTEAVMKEVSMLESRLESLIQEFRDKDDWFEKLQESMDRHEKNIDKILQGLEKEIEDRRSSDERLEGKTDKFREEISTHMKSAYKIAAIVGVLGAIVFSLFSYFLQTKSSQQQTTVPQYNPVQQTTHTDSVPRELKDSIKK